MYKLDKKDKEILYELDLDSRQSFNQVGRKIKLGKEVVQYRIKQLEKQGIIKGYQTLIDVSKLGYLTCRFFIKFRGNTPEEEIKIIEYYKKNPKFWWVDSIGGFIDLGLACWVKDIYEFFEIKEDLTKRFGKFINELKISIYYKFYIFNRKYLSNRKESHEKVMLFPEKADFDEKDLEILRLISGDARANVVEVSEKTKISVSNVSYRINNLIKKRVILGFKVLLDLEKIGYYWYKVEMQLSDMSVKKQMLEYFKHSKNIVYAYETISENDIEFELEVQSHEEFKKSLDEIRKLFGKSIKKDYYFIWGKEHKFLFMP
jgi:DNA-binding Lrp family transcriptional regulator